MTSGFFSRRAPLGNGRCRAALTAISLSFGLLPAVVAAHGDAAGEQMRVKMQSHASYSMERCIEAHAGQWLRARFDTPQPVDFNIHRHAETVTEYPLKRRVSGALDERVRLVADGEYCFQWVNPQNLDTAFAFDFRFELSDDG